MIRKIFLAMVFATLMPVVAMAQSSMTDAQIIEFVQKEQKAGTSQGQIVTKLMQKGVTVDRLRQVRKKYEKMGGQSAQGATDLSDKSDRSRKPKATQNDQNVSPYRMTDANMQNTYDEKDAAWNEMRTELGDFMPDSLGMFDREMEQMYRNQRRVFGRDIFNNKNLSFEPNMNIATPQNYVLGPGDQVFVDVYGASQKNVETTVSPDGYINIEGYGPVAVSGLTVAQATSRLRSTLGQRYAGSSIKLTIGETRSIMVNVMGEVRVPGTYTLSAFSSVFHALYMAGGVSDIGTLRDIKVYRKGKLVSSVDIYDYILNGKLTGNVKLSDNDVIVVGTYDCLVNVTGKVKRPMFYEMKKDESLGTLLKYAGGFTGDAYRNTVRVTRKAGKEYSVWNVTEFDMNEFKLCDEDSVSVDSVIARFENIVELRGAVLRPGMYQIGEKVTTVRDLLNIADGLQDEAFTDHIILHRMREDHTLEVLPLNLTAILNGTDADIPLQSEDVVFIPSKEERNKNQVLKIYGEVYYPGQYQYAEGMTVEDFILQAGGLKESAAKNKVTISRREVAQGQATTDKKGNTQVARGTRAKTFEIEIKDGFVLDGNEGFKLQPFDEVYVNKNPEYREQASITVEGEVMGEGTYSLSSDNTRVSDVLAMCGGVTAQAAKNGAYIMRKFNSEEERRRLTTLDKTRASWAYALSNGAQMTTDAKLRYPDSLLVERDMREDCYKLAVNLQKSLAEPGCVDDVILRDGDRLIVEPMQNTVRISGSVPYANAVPYVEGKMAKYYIQQSGTRGRKNRKWAYVVYQNGSSAMVRDGAKIEPGCEIILPERSTASNTTQNVSLIVSLLTSLATVGAVIVSVLK